MSYQEVLLFLGLVVLLIIAYKLHRLEAQLVFVNSKPNLTISTTLTPVFSEQEIALQRDAIKKWKEKVELARNYLNRIESEEILSHHNSGKDKSYFRPSDTLKKGILQYSFDNVGLHKNKVTLEQMIEANIAVLKWQAYFDSIGRSF